MAGFWDGDAPDNQNDGVTTLHLAGFTSPGTEGGSVLRMRVKQQDARLWRVFTQLPKHETSKHEHDTLPCRTVKNANAVSQIKQNTSEFVFTDFELGLIRPVHQTATRKKWPRFTCDSRRTRP